MRDAVIEWLKDEVEQHRRPPVLMAPAPPSSSPSPAAKRKQAEADASDKRSWMSSAQLWTCGSHSNGGIRKQQAQKVEEHGHLKIMEHFEEDDLFWGLQSFSLIMVLGKGSTTGGDLLLFSYYVGLKT